MLYNIPCRIYILSTLSLCISGIVSTATATSSETKISNEETLVVTTNRSASNLWESPATISPSFTSPDIGHVTILDLAVSQLSALQVLRIATSS